MSTVLIYRLGSMGDTVVALPCFHKIAATYPDARRIVITNRPVATNSVALKEILAGSGLVHGYIDYPVGLRNPLAIAKLAREIRRTSARDLVYLTDRPRLLAVWRDMAFFRLLGIRRIIGAPISREQRNCKIESKTGLHEHEARRLARCLSSLGRINLDDAAVWDLRLRREEIERATQSLSPLAGRTFIAVHVGSKEVIKDWGDENWMHLLASLSRRYCDLGLVFVGASDEATRCSGLAAAWAGPTLNLCGGFPPRSTAAVLARAMLFIGHDSGPMHLAASQGTPCVALFGVHEPPQRWHPYGVHHSIIHNMRGILSIQPKEVFWQVCAGIEERHGLLGRTKVRQAAQKRAPEIDCATDAFPELLASRSN
jgi:heptosyltransferase III